MIFATERKADMPLTPQEKLLQLETRLKELGRVAVAFSGGADSSFLAYTTGRILGNQAFLFTIWSPLLSEKEKGEIFSFAERYDMPLIRIPTDETDSREFCANTPERCYICKSIRLKTLERYADQWHIPWVLDGSNIDDLNDYRPGMRALSESKRTLSPLLECGLRKTEIRELSAASGLPTAEKPASACLASRIPTGVKVSKELLTQIDRGEDILRKYLPENAQIRLRFDGKRAKIETDQSFISGLSDKLDIIKAELLDVGISDVLIEPKGYIMGSVTYQQR